jgi:hypothetical protein
MVKTSIDELTKEVEKKRKLVREKNDALEDQKKARLLEELDKLNSELSTSNSSILSSEPSSSSTSSCAVIQDALAETDVNSNMFTPTACDKRVKNNMFSYYVVTANTTEAERVALDTRRVTEAKINSESRESAKCHERKTKIHSQSDTRGKSKTRPCPKQLWDSLFKNLNENDKKLIEYDGVLKTIWCAACACFVRGDALVGHVITGKHKGNIEVSLEKRLHYTRIENAINGSTLLSKSVANRTHLFRCDLVETILTAGDPMRKSDEYRDFHERWINIQQTDSSNLTRYYLPIITVIIALLILLIYFSLILNFFDL